MLAKIKETIDYIFSKTDARPRVGVILGTGLGGLTDEIRIIDTISYSDIPHFPVSTVEGHKGNMIFGTLGEQPIVAMQGRFHFYEGYNMAEVTYPIRVMKYLGVELLILSNASGGLNPAFEVGDLMLITDHINLMPNPLIGRNDDALGPRFPDMSEAYSKDILERVKKIAFAHKISFQTGVYAGVTGPTFETKAEYKYIHIIGADAVGMSTVPEVIVARHMGMTCFAFSVISDLGVEGKIVEITHQQVIQAASAVEPRMTTIIKELLKDL
ncbi:MAG: purine-nucleoside phosphorylase [Bacteroidota bacterium]